MLFVFKQLLKALIMPLPGILLMGFVGVYLLWRNRRPRLGRGLITVALGLLFLASMEPLVAGWGERLERQYPAYADQPVDYILVLGEGHTSDPELPLTSWPSPATLYRVTEGLRLAARNPQARVIFSGYGGTDGKSAAEVNQRLAVELGLDPTRILVPFRRREVTRNRYPPICFHPTPSSLQNTPPPAPTNQVFCSFTIATSLTMCRTPDLSA